MTDMAKWGKNSDALDFNPICVEKTNFVEDSIFFDLSDNELQNRRNKMNGLDLLRKIKQGSIKVVFFDPQYRGVLDKMKYGNEGKDRGKDRSSLPQMDSATICEFMKGIEYVLKPSGYLFLWIDKFHLVDGIASWISQGIEAVDLITWNKEKIGMGYRTRRMAEYLLVLQKAPRFAKTTWTLHNIPDVWSEMVVKTHPHSKPLGLQLELLKATTIENDFVCDPASGGYSVFECCRRLGRNFVGCDLAM